MSHQTRKSRLRNLSYLAVSLGAGWSAGHAHAITITGTTQLSAPATTAPGSIAGLVVHLDANDVNNTGTNPANGTQISTWVNKAAGGAGNFTGSGSLPYVNWTGNPMNGNATVHFWGGLLRNATNFGNDVTVMYVGRMDGGANQRLVAGNANNWLLGYWGGGMNRTYWNGSPSDLAGIGIDYNSHIYVGVADGTTATSYRGDPVETQFNTGLLGAGGQGPNGLSLGGWGAGAGGAGSEHSYGDIGELLVFNRDLTAGERAQMQQYLQTKWYGQLASTEAVTINAGGTLDLNGVNQTIGSLAGAVGGQVLLNGAWLTTGQDGTSTTYSGTIADGSNPGEGFSKIGAGIQTLAGTAANTYSGTTVISQGSLVLSKTAGVAALPGNILMVNSLNPNIWMTADNQLGGNGVLSFATEVNNIIGHGRFMLEGTAQTLAGIQSLSTFQAGVVQNSESAFGPSPANTGTGLLTLAGSGNYSFNGYLRNGSGANFGTLSIAKTGSGTQTFSGNQISYTGATQLTGGTLELLNASSFNSATTVGSGATLKLSNTFNMSTPAGFTVALNNGGTLIHNALTNNNGFLVMNGAVTNSGNTTINQNSVTNTTGGNKSLFLDGGLKGTGVVTINALNAGNGVIFRNNNSTFSGKIIVNGIASTVANAGSGIGVGGNTSGLINADIELNGTMELLNQGVGWAAGAPGDFFMGALSGNGVMVGNFTGGGETRVRLGNNNNSGVFSGVIANGTGNVIVLTKNGTGTQTFTGANLYSGTTTVSGGTLLVNNTTGSGLGTGNVVVLANATLGGTGAFTGPTLVNTNATLAPGGVGILESLDTGNLTFANDAIYHWDFLGAAADVTNVLGTLSFGSSLTLVANDLGGDGFKTSVDYVLFTYTGADPTMPTINFQYPGYQRLEFRVDTATNRVLANVIIPEPATMSLLALSSLGLLRRRRQA